MRRALVLLAALAVAGCGGDADPRGPAPRDEEPTPEATSSADPLAPPPEETTSEPSRVRITTGRRGELSFSEPVVTAAAGRLTFELINRGSAEHALAIRGRGVNVQGALVPTGKVSRVEIALEPGRYRFFCPVPGHADGGMTGQLRVR